MAKRNYPRTAALLGAQPVVARQPRGVYRTGQTDALAISVPWKVVLPVVLVSATLLWLWLDPSWYVGVPRIRVTGSVVAETRREVALASDVLGLHGLWIRPSAIVSEVLAAVPVVYAADVNYRIYPASCTITVKEREPVLVWNSGDGPRWVDAEGYVMPVREERPDLPAVSGPLPGGERVPLSVIEGMRALQACELPGGLLGYHHQRGLLWYSPDGVVVAFGVGTDMAVRWDFYQRLITQLRDQGIAPSAVDVRFLRAPVYKLSGTW